ncbi:beta-1,3-galactosyltransferase 5-like [Haliotis rubra]|uniref:beta-1,3-galactosyltransferase 5-like n=1 Tax=Haliotis rubra TaxID=36100 RepID=UPI001EE5140C|nr:beta-1,3-galactosyltransferase 5-like [Haliotis rubra]
MMDLIVPEIVKMCLCLRNCKVKRRKLKIMAVMVIFSVVCLCYDRLRRGWSYTIYRHSSYHDVTQPSTQSDTTDLNLGLDLTDDKLKEYVTSGVVMNDFKFLVNSDVCKSAQSVYVLVIVPSKPTNLDERTAIRQTWGSRFKMEVNLKLVFLLGLEASHVDNQLAEEQKTHADIVQGNFIDSYKNLTLKTVAMLQWSRQFCPLARYVMKVDDDVFLETDNLLSKLNLLDTESRFILGYTDIADTPIRNSTNKWYVSFEQYPFTQFPRFVHGPAYVISGDLVADLFKIARHAPPIHLEDVYVTGLCAHIARASHVSTSGVGLEPKQWHDWIHSKSVIAAHGYTPSAMRYLWLELVKWRHLIPLLRFMGTVYGY